MAAVSAARNLTNEALKKHHAGDLPAAETLYRRALALVPEYPDALHYLGLLSHQAGNLPPAIVLLERAAQLRPRVAHFHGNLADVYRAVGRPDEAAAAYRRAIRCDPRAVAPRLNFAVLLWKTGDQDAALTHFHETLKLDPRSMQALLGTGAIYKDVGLLDQALDAFRTAAASDGHGVQAAHNSLLYTLNFHPGYSPGEIFDAHRAWAVQHADPLTAAAPPLAVDRDPARRLKIGYVSSYFRDHAVNFFVEPLLAAHDRAAFEITCYSDTAPPDAVTARLRARADRWRHTLDQSDAHLAASIREDGIDLLVDLNGHMGPNRLLAFARRAAPVQVTYLGYQATTGMSAMDYRLTDAYADPDGATGHWHTETLVRLPRAFFCYQPPEDAPSVTDPPSGKDGAVTFGSFNHFGKVTPQVLGVWAEILARTPGSRLRLLVPRADSLRRRVLSQMAAAGVGEERVVFVEHQLRREYLEGYQTVDIALDPFPFNSHTTSCDALWMGVPTVMLRGQSYAQRYGGSALVNLGLETLIADTPAEYVATAAAWAADTARLTQVRRTLRERMRASDLCDAVGFTRRLEAAYRGMWRAYCEGP